MLNNTECSGTQNKQPEKMNIHFPIKILRAATSSWTNSLVGCFLLWLAARECTDLF